MNVAFGIVVVAVGVANLIVAVARPDDRARAARLLLGVILILLGVLRIW